MQRKLILTIVLLLAFTSAANGQEAKQIGRWPLDKIKQYGEKNTASMKQWGYWPVSTTGGPVCNSLVPNGCFDYWTSDNPDSYVLYPSENADNYVTEVNGACRIKTTVDASAYLRTSGNIFESGKTYDIYVTITSLTEGRLRIYQGNSVNIKGDLTAVGTYYIRWTATATAPLYIYTHWSPNNTDLIFDNVLITEVP